MPRQLVRVALACGGLLLAATSRQAHAQDSLPPAATRPIDFAADVKPILQASCVRCHARGRARGGFSIETRERLLRGGDDGPAVVPGDSAGSELVRLIAGLEPDEVMPKKGARLTAAQIGILRAWIDQGLAWDPAVSFAKALPRHLVPRRPELAAAGPSHPVDRLIAAYYDARHVEPPQAADDRRFVRRVYLDAVGVLPSPAELAAFLSDAQPGKRTRLVAALLADDRRYAEHWLSFWNDLLRNDYQGTGYIDGGRLQISAWLYGALAANMPYDRFVAALVSGAPGAEGFTKGIVWRGVVNASQTAEMQAAQNVSQVFMGVNLKCASCHDSFINDWQLSDSYGLAGVYAAGPLEMVECDRPTGTRAPLKFLYPELGTIDADAGRATRLAQLSHLLVGPKNGRLSRTIVNRLWARFMGRGLVEPLDDMEQPAWSDDLLDWLAEDLVAHRYDLKRTMRLILTSSAYQAQAVDEGDRSAPYEFHGPRVKRLTAEQFVDAVAALTGVWPAKAAGQFDFAHLPEQVRPVPGHTRAALLAATPLTSALGRPNREQVVTERAASPTTLQALELSNGQTLAELLRKGAAKLAATGPRPTNSTIDRLFVKALARPASADEHTLARRQFGPTLDATEIEDVLWSIAMLPEFQLVR